MGDGVCVDALNPANRPSPAEVAALGASLVRIAPREDPTMWAYLEDLQQVTNVALVYDSDAPPPPHQTAAVLYVIGNEPDAILTPEPNGASWEMTTEQYRALWDAYAPAILTAQPDARLCIAAQMGIGGRLIQDGGWLRDLLSAGPLAGAAAVGLNLYLMEPGPDNVERGRACIRQLAALVGLPVYVSEWTVPDEDVAAFAAMLRAETIGSTWFTWGGVPGHELVGYPSLGLLTAALHAPLAVA